MRQEGPSSCEAARSELDKIRRMKPVKPVSELHLRVMVALLAVGTTF